MPAQEREGSYQFYTVVYVPPSPGFPAPNAQATYPKEAKYGDVCSKECADNFLERKGVLKEVKSA